MTPMSPLSDIEGEFDIVQDDLKGVETNIKFKKLEEEKRLKINDRMVRIAKARERLRLKKEYKEDH